MLIGLVGCGGFGREVMPLVHDRLAVIQTDADVVFVETVRTAGPLVNGYGVLSEAEFFNAAGAKQFNIAISDSKVRQEIAERFVRLGAEPIELRSADTVMYDHNVIAEGAIFCSGSIITSDAKIGRYFHSNLQSYIAHDCLIGDFVTFAPRVACNGNVVIEDHAYIGTGAMIRQGLRIGRGATVGMGAVVTKDVPAGQTWVGNPARALSR
jgi:sugar O-acyltransferase (sialic acid O-acetyltransferase NeuD family)